MFELITMFINLISKVLLAHEFENITFNTMGAGIHSIKVNVSEQENQFQSHINI